MKNIIKAILITTITVMVLTGCGMNTNRENENSYIGESSILESNSENNEKADFSSVIESVETPMGEWQFIGGKNPRMPDPRLDFDTIFYDPYNVPQKVIDNINLYWKLLLS